MTDDFNEDPKQVYDRWRLAQLARGPSIWVDRDPWNEAELPRRPWVARGFLLRRAVTLVAGPPSSMKSSVMLGWAIAVALNREWGAFCPTGSGTVIVFNVEDDLYEQRRRMSALLRQFGAEPENIKNKVISVGPHSIGTLLERDEEGTIHFTQAMEELNSLVAEVRPSVLIVDPLSELHTCEENDNVALRAVIATFRSLAIEHDLAIAVLHHTRKGSASAPGDPDIARGASAIVGACRVALTLTTMSEADADEFGLSRDITQRGNYVRLDDAKQNYAAIEAARWFEKVPIWLDNNEVVAAALPWTPPEAKVATDADLVALKAAIQRGCLGGEPYSEKLSKEPRSVRVLLEQHGFGRHTAQRAALAQLKARFGLEVRPYRNPRNRAATGGMRIDGKPAADWIRPKDGEPDGEAEEPEEDN